MEPVDVVFITPPFDFSVINATARKSSKQGGYYLYYPPVGLCSMARALADAGFSVSIIDGVSDAGGDLDRVCEMAAALRPRIAGVSVTTPALPVIKEIVSRIKKNCDATVVAGGAHVSCDPKIINGMGADYAVIGDGETPVVHLAEKLLRGKAPDLSEYGVYKAGDDEIPAPFVSPAEELPAPDRSFLRNPLAYFNPFIDTKSTQALTARGCPFHCSFCSRNPAMGAYRPLPVETAINELQELSDTGYGFVSIIDETFTFDRDRCLHIVRAIKERRMKFRWSCQTRADLVDAELLAVMADAGCMNISFGLEAGDEKVREGLDKRIANDAFTNAVEHCHRAGITVNAFVIIGSPEETRQHVERSISRAVELRPDYAVFNIGTLFPGTREYEKKLESGEIDRTVWDDYMNGKAELPILSKTMDKAELAELLRIGYSRFYLRPGFVLNKIRSIKSMADIAKIARQAKTVVTDYVVSRS